MKPTGIVRKVDHAGRILIPKSIRDTAGVREYDFVEVRASRNKDGTSEIILRRVDNYNPYETVDDEKSLEEYINALREELTSAKKRLARLRSKKR